MQARKIIGELGGPKAVAAAIGRPKSSVGEWYTHNWIPHDAGMRDICDLAHRMGKRIDVEDLLFDPDHPALRYPIHRRD